VSVPPDPPRRGMPPRLTLTLATALAIVIAIAVASVRMNPSSRRHVVVVLPSAPGLRQGSAMTYLGVEAGRVESIDLSTGRVVARLGISRSDVTLRAGDAIRLGAVGLFGDQVVDVTPGPRSARALGDGDTLVVTALTTRPPSPDSAALVQVLRSLQRRDSTGAAPASTTRP
jgi:phospholipid/cholesterol/gamma-HCH transport system substrate-binding protein